MPSHTVLDIPLTSTNTRNTEGSFITLHSGRILFAYTRFGADSKDHGSADIVYRTSDDDGRTWSAKDTLLIENTSKVNVMSVSFARLANGNILLLNLRKDARAICMPVVRISGDEAKTWSKPKTITPIKGFYVVNNDRLVVLSSGRIVAPACMHRLRCQWPPASPQDRPWARPRFTEPGLITFFISDDHGKTWCESMSALYTHTPQRDGLQEPGIVELTNGRLWGWARPAVESPKSAQWCFESTDQGNRWTPAVRSSFRTPQSPMSIKRIPSTGDLLAVFNDHSGRFPVNPLPAAYNRTPLVAAVSDDEGKTWKHHRRLESSRAEGFAYTAIHFVQDAVLLAYYHGIVQSPGLLNCTQRLRRLPLKWFYAAR